MLELEFVSWYHWYSMGFVIGMVAMWLLMYDWVKEMKRAKEHSDRTTERCLSQAETLAHQKVQLIGELISFYFEGSPIINHVIQFGDKPTIKVGNSDRMVVVDLELVAATSLRVALEKAKLDWYNVDNVDDVDEE